MKAVEQRTGERNLSKRRKNKQKLTIQQVAAVAIDAGISFEPQQPILVDGKFVAQYKLDGVTLTPKETLKKLSLDFVD